MVYSLKFVLAFLVAGAIATPVTLSIQHRETQAQAKTVAAQLTGGDPDRGRADVTRRQCGACHKMMGLPGADGDVGPDLTGLPRRATIAGRLANNPQSLIQWLKSPHSVIADVGMPDMGIGDAEARDIAAFLYTLRGV